MARVTECGNADEIIILNADNRPIFVKTEVILLIITLICKQYADLYIRNE